MLTVFKNIKIADMGFGVMSLSNEIAFRKPGFEVSDLFDALDPTQSSEVEHHTCVKLLIVLCI